VTVRLRSVKQREAGIISDHINLQSDVWSQLTELPTASAPDLLQPRFNSATQTSSAPSGHVCQRNSRVSREGLSVYSVELRSVVSLRGWKNTGVNILFRKFSAGCGHTIDVRGLDVTQQHVVNASS
jgi:hypothetical protein